MTLELDQVLQLLGYVAAAALAFGIVRAGLSAQAKALGDLQSSLKGLGESFDRLSGEIKPLAVTSGQLEVRIGAAEKDIVQLAAQQVSDTNRLREEISRLGLFMQRVELFMQRVELQVAKFGMPDPASERAAKKEIE